MESKRLFLAMLLSVAIVLGYEWWYSRFAPPRPPAPAGQQQPAPAGTPAAAGPSAPAPRSEATGGQPASPAARPPAAPPAGAAGAASSREAARAPRGEAVTVRTPRFEARFTTAGGALTDLRLLGYRTSPAPGSPPVAIADLPAGALLPTVGHLAGPSAQPAGEPGSAPAPSVLYAVDPPGGLALGPGERGVLTFTATTPGGLRVVSRYTFEAGSYAFQLEQSITNAGSRPAVVQPALLVRHGRDPQLEKATGHEAGALALTPGGVRRVGFNDATGAERIPGPVEWAGWQEKYFAGLVLPKGPAVEAVVVGQQPAVVAAAGGANGVAAAATPVGEVEVLYPAATVAPGGSAGMAVRVYMGPKDVGALRQVDPSLERVIDLGFFHWIAMPLLLTLRWIHGFVGNYGLAIIVLTLIVKLAFWPLTAKQIKSSKAMQKLQPLMTQIREKYKDDREAMNREMMELFRRHNVNPLMGCLPVAVQLPVFFALYRVLNDSIELRHAPFFGWIRDLSAADPYYVSPILMGVAWLVTQKMMPVPGDPTQQKIMLMVPVLSTFMFLWMPSGLVLYWLVQNVLQIGQQIYTNRLTT